MAAIIAEHPKLGTVHGKHVDGVAQFLGIKYASLKDRLAPPDLVDEYPLRTVDATNLGCVSQSNLLLV
jgi:carboxylesterase type B